MKKHLTSLGIGCVLGIAGLVLWLTTGNVQTPVISLSKVGVVLAVLGGVEVAVAVVALALPSTRRREYEL